MHRVLHVGGRLLPAVVLALMALPVASNGAQLAQRGGQRGGNRSLQEAMRIPASENVQRFDATVSRVRVDVIVTDGDGNFVADLSAADFSIFEDGAPQEVLGVQLVDLRAGAVQPLFGNQPAAGARRSGGATAQPPGAGDAARTPAITSATGDAARAPATTPATEDAARAPATTPATGDAAAELGALIFLVDGPSLGQQTRARFGDAWNDLLDTTDALQVPRAAYMVDNVGRVQQLAALGDNLKAMRVAADTVREAPFFGNNTRRRMLELASDLNTPGLTPEVTARLAQAKAKSFESEERRRALATYELLTSFADALGTRAGRTAVVWVSTGVKLMQGGPYTAIFAQDPSATAEGTAGARFDIVSPDPQIKSAQEALHRAANGSNVSFYTVDPSLLAETRFASADVESTSSAATGLLTTPAVQQSIDGLRDSLRTAAAETGGKSFVHATDIAAVLREIEQDTSRFYLVSYRPPAPEGDGDFHQIRVDVARAGVEVRSRTGYIDHPPEARAQRLIAAALALPGSVRDLPVAAEAFVSRPGAAAPNVLLAIAVEGSQVGVMAMPTGERRVSLDLHAIALTDRELFDESHEQLNASFAQSGGSQTVEATDPALPTLVGYIAYQHEWTLPPGEYTLNVAAFDNVTGRLGAASIEVEVPQPEVSTWGISDPLLITVDDAGRPHPVVKGRVVEGRDLMVFVEAYGGARPILSGQVFRETDAAPEQQRAELFSIALRRVASTTHRGSAPLPPGMPPGRYVVQLVIADAAVEQHRVVRLPLEVVGYPSR